jgi:hypothetical protein
LSKMSKNAKNHDFCHFFKKIDIFEKYFLKKFEKFLKIVKTF